MEQKPHIALLPSPGMGHLIPLVELAKLLLLHHDFHITCIIPVLGSPSKAMKAVLQALPTSIDHVFLPPVILEEEEIKGLKLEVQAMLTLTHSLPPLRDVLKPTRFSAFVVDPFGIDALDIAKELNISPYIFFPSNAFALSLVLHLPKLDETVSCEYRDLPEPIKLPGCIPIHGRDLLEPVQDRTSELYKMFLSNTKRYRLAEVGPIQSGSSNQVDKSESDCLRWLDNQPHGSVLFVCFGSGGTLSYEQTNELALGLELSGQKFIWVVRTPNNESADATYLSDQTLGNNPLAFLPKGFVERTKGQGLVVPFWAPQAQVLSHGSTGGFLTHCGWNSTLESIMQGIPLIVWPLFAEQKKNAALLAEDLKVALRPKTNKNGLIDREEIAKVVKGLMF
ncbi:hydroquinone glucosyltransferase [Quercus suber]|uniref:Hydroquinone glucosyltransferase n=1 Tax=Quercus suber TaxID=58331 RepID=A0AAW0KT06_QUESU